jgi:hypothetical protein
MIEKLGAAGFAAHLAPVNIGHNQAPGLAMRARAEADRHRELIEPSPFPARRFWSKERSRGA